ncbi:MAG: ACT domain-containing protein [Clostridiales bacterium]|nr:ACT domain-containing protein [Clostridiales bacterium]
MRAVITVIGKDTTGIIAKVSNMLFENNINILDISQTVLQDFFTMIMIVDIEKSSIKFEDMLNQLNMLGKEMGLSIRMQHEDIFNSMHNI